MPNPAPAPQQPLERAFFDRPAPELAPDLIGRVLRCTLPEGVVAVRLTEVEAYTGGEDPASHAFRGRTARNAVMFGPPGFVYVYFTYGMHYCMNLVAGPDGTAAAVLLRAGEIVEGLDLARRRRPSARSDRELAQGPARLTQALGVSRPHNGLPATGPTFHLLPGTPPSRAHVSTGPRTGVSQAADTPYRFWLTTDPTVSPYRRHVPKKRS